MAVSGSLRGNIAPLRHAREDETTVHLLNINWHLEDVSNEERYRDQWEEVELDCVMLEWIKDDRNMGGVQRPCVALRLRQWILSHAGGTVQS